MNLPITDAERFANYRALAAKAMTAPLQTDPTQQGTEAMDESRLEAAMKRIEAIHRQIVHAVRDHHGQPKLPIGTHAIEIAAGHLLDVVRETREAALDTPARDDGIVGALDGNWAREEFARLRDEAYSSAAQHDHRGEYSSAAVQRGRARAFDEAISFVQPALRAARSGEALGAGREAQNERDAALSIAALVAVRAYEAAPTPPDAGKVEGLVEALKREAAYCEEQAKRFTDADEHAEALYMSGQSIGLRDAINLVATYRATQSQAPAAEGGIRKKIALKIHQAIYPGGNYEYASQSRSPGYLVAEEVATAILADLGTPPTPPSVPSQVDEGEASEEAWVAYCGGQWNDPDDRRDRELFKAGYLAALRTHKRERVPEGFVLVPREPDKGFLTRIGATYELLRSDGLSHEEATYEAALRAGLTASPAPQDREGK